jgi:hypothetical protein
MTEAQMSNRSDPVELWFITGERVRIKNKYITCPGCKGREYVVSVRGTIAIAGERRGVLIDDTHKCPHCGKPYESPVVEKQLLGKLVLKKGFHTIQFLKLMGHIIHWIMVIHLKSLNTMAMETVV